MLQTCLKLPNHTTVSDRYKKGKFCQDPICRLPRFASSNGFLHENANMNLPQGLHKPCTFHTLYLYPLDMYITHGDVVYPS